MSPIRIHPIRASTPDFDNRRFTYTADTSTVSGKIKRFPTCRSSSSRRARGVAARAAEDGAAARTEGGARQPEDWTRWNDYGIGFLLQGDLKHAQAAFTRVAEIAPKNPDGWVNIGRVRVQEGNVAGAREVLERALALAPDLARANYFMSRVEKAEGNLDASLASLRKVIAQYPKDRVVRNDAGRAVPAAAVSRGRSSSSMRRWPSTPRT